MVDVRRAAAALALVLPLALVAGCGPRYSRVRIYEHRFLNVTLRAEVVDGERVDRGYAHPVTISSVRIAHILSRIDVRFETEDGGERKPAFETTLLYTVGEKMALAFAQADPSQEVVVQAVRQERRFGIFHARHLTSFTAAMVGDDMRIELSRVDWTIPKEEQNDDLPEPWPGKQVQDFKAIAAEGVIPTGTQTVLVDWRSPVFREPTHVKVGPGGTLLRREILMESPLEGEPIEEEDVPLVPANLSAETLRALADLQDQRTRGEISESLYHQQRRDLLREAADELEAAEEAADAP